MIPCFCCKMIISVSSVTSSLLQNFFCVKNFHDLLPSYFQICNRVLLTVCVCVSRSVVSDSLQPHGLKPARLLCPWDFPGKNIGEGCHFLLQGIFLSQGYVVLIFQKSMTPRYKIIKTLFLNLLLDTFKLNTLF